MKKFNIYIITCDKSNHILNVTIPLLDKYWNIDKSVKILGFDKPQIDLPIDYEFISMRPKQLSIDDWGKDIASVIEKDTDDIVMFMLDDFLPIDYVNPDILNVLLSKFSDQNTFRCALGIDMHFWGYDIEKQYGDFKLIRMKQNTPYRVTTQPSLWRKSELLKYLKNTTNPWSFETDNNPNNGIVYGTLDKYTFRWIEESALSGRHPNKFNILGMKPSDVKWLLEQNLINKDQLQFGQYIGVVPQFNDYGFNFKLSDLKPFIDNNRYNQYILKYGKFYE